MNVDPSNYPGIHRAYDFVLPSYSWALDRLKSVDGRLQEVMAYAATLTFAAPVIVATLQKEPDFTAWPFLLALTMFLLILAIGLVARTWGLVALPSPTTFYQKWSHFDDWTFKKNAVLFAGKHLERNQRLINNKGWAVTAMTVLLALELFLLLGWAIDQI
jgi:hypothetical protein